MEESLKSSGEKIIDNLTSRLKIPIIATYVIVLGFQNWDIIYFIIFAKLDVIDKIHFLKSNYDCWDYIRRVFGSLGYAVFLLILFTLIDYYLLKYLKRFSIGKKNIQEEIASANLLKEYQTKYEKLLIDNEETVKNYEIEVKNKKAYIDVVEHLKLKLNETNYSSRLGNIILEIKKNNSNNNIDKKLEILTQILNFIRNKNNPIDVKDIVENSMNDSSNLSSNFNQTDLNNTVMLLLNILLKSNYISFDHTTKPNTIYTIKNDSELEYLYNIFLKNNINE